MKQSPQTTSSRRLKLRFVLFVGPIFCLSLCELQPTSALFNCFKPNNMFQLGKFGQHPGERAHWYPQMSIYQGYGHNPMSRLFKSKWMGGGGGGLFGPKRWIDWRMNAGNMNHLYRPPQAAYWSPMMPSSYQYNQFSDGLNLAPYPTQQQHLPPYSNTGGTGTKLNPSTTNYSANDNRASITQLNSNYNNDGWTYPSVSPYSRPGGGQSGQLNYGGDAYSVLPNNYQPSKQQLDPYGTKGGGGSGSGTKTAKKVLIADGARNTALQEIKRHY